MRAVQARLHVMDPESHRGTMPRGAGEGGVLALGLSCHEVSSRMMMCKPQLQMIDKIGLTVFSWIARKGEVAPQAC